MMMRTIRTVAAVMLTSAAASMLTVGVSAHAQTNPAMQAPIMRQALPDENTLARLVWATMVALDNANRTENYTVLYFLGSPQFQQRNTPAALSQSFTDLRRNRVDIGRTILSTPTYYIPPQILADGTLRLRGGFDYRPKFVRFDLIFANINGGWQINAISVAEMDASTPKQ